MGTVVVLIALFIGSGVLQGAKYAHTPLRVTGLTYGLIYGHFGLPTLGPIGSAWATFLARALALLLKALWRRSSGVTISGRGERPDLGVARQVLSIGVPAALEQVLATLRFLALAVVVTRLGTDTLAAQWITFNALLLSFLLGIGFGIAATALPDQVAVLWMSTIAVLLIIFAPQLVGLFSSCAAVIEAGVPGLRVLVLTQPFRTVLFIQAGALRGMGNTRFPLLTIGLSIWTAVGVAFGLLNTGGGLVSITAEGSVPRAGSVDGVGDMAALPARRGPVLNGVANVL
jgi:multidrug resistance protein, MATE family